MKLTKYRIDLPTGEIYLLCRNHVESDVAILKNVFTYRMFDTRRFPEHHHALNAYYKHLLNHDLEPVILDVGANIGAASCFFSVTYPRSIVLGIEPANDNFTLLQENMSGRNFKGICAAVGAKDGFSKLNTRDHGPIGYRVDECAGNVEVVITSIDSILAKLASNQMPLILKLDIEGAESALFEFESNYLNKFPLIIMEPHDWMIPFQSVSREFFKQIIRYNFDFLMHGENIFLFNNEILSSYKNKGS